MGRDVERSRVLGGTHYVGWVRLRPRLGYEREFAQLVSMSPHVVLEAHRLGDRIEFYAWIRDVALPLLRRRASVELVEEPPELPQKWVAELRAPSGAWETGVEASEAWLSVYDWLEPGEAVQVVGFYDARIHRELARKARHYRLGERPELRGLGPLEYHPRDPDRARHLSQLSTRRIYVTAIRFYSNDKKRARELGERASGLFTPALRVRVSRRGSPSKLRDPLSLMGRFSPKKEYPWIPQESFMHLVRLPRPDEVAARLDFARGAALPQVAPKPRGPCVRLGELENGEEYCLPLEDLERHAWVIGQTGSGKSTFLWNLVLRLHRLGKAAIVVIDPHGDLAFDILESVPRLDHVYLLDPTRKPFGMNPLDLPRLPDRAQAVALAVDHLLTIFEKVLKLPETAVNVRYLLQVLLRFMYERMDSPTLGDIYAAVVALYNGELDLPVEDPEWRVQVEALRRLQDQTFLSALSRLEPFANHPILRRITSRTTVPLEEVLQPGSLVLIRLPKGELGESLLRLLAPAIVLRLWFYVLERAARGGERTPIYVIVDEFQNLAGLPVVETILSEARKYGLHLIMAHQHTKQLPEQLLQSVFSNTGVKVVFRVGGGDLEKLKALDPEFAAELGKVLAGLTTGRAVVKRAGLPGEEAPPPIIVRTDPPPRRRLENIGTVLQRVGRFAPPPEPSGEGDIVSRLNPVLRYLPKDRLDPVEAWVLFHVYVATEGGSREELWSSVLLRLGVPRSRADEARNSLAARGLVEARREGNRWLVRYVKGLFEGLRSVAPGDEGYRVAREALLYYFSRGYVVYPARQDPGLPSKPDLVAIPFDPSSMSLRYDKAVAVEVESCNELATHPEQAARNLLKHPRGVFAETHVWAPPGCRGRLEELLAGVRDRLPLPARVMPPEDSGAGDAGEAGVEVEASGEAAPEKISDDMKAAEGAEPGAGGEILEEAPGEPRDPVRKLLEAQAGLLTAMSRAQAEILQAQRASSEKIDRVLEALNRMNQLLEQQTRLLERLLEQQRGEDTHGESTEPEAEPDTQTQQTPQQPEYNPDQNCYWVKLDTPEHEELCLPEPKARKALELRARGYRLKKTRTGRIYATRGTSRIWI